MIEVNFQEMNHTYIHTIQENSTTHVDNEFTMIMMITYYDCECGAELRLCDDVSVLSWLL